MNLAHLWQLIKNGSIQEATLTKQGLYIKPIAPVTRLDFGAMLESLQITDAGFSIYVGADVLFSPNDFAEKLSQNDYYLIFADNTRVRLTDVCYDININRKISERLHLYFNCQYGNDNERLHDWQAGKQNFRLLSPDKVVHLMQGYLSGLNQPHFRDNVARCYTLIAKHDPFDRDYNYNLILKATFKHG